MNIEAKIKEGWIPFTIGLSKQEYNNMRSELKRSEAISQYKDKFIVVEEYSEPASDCVMLTIIAESGEIIYKVAAWVELVHQQRKQIFGDNYKIDPDWDDPKYN